MNLIYRQARPQDAVELASLHAETWLDTYKHTSLSQVMSGSNLDSRYSFWKNALLGPNRWVMVCEAGSSLVGFVSLLEQGPAEAEISAFYVSPRYQGLGIGTYLFEHVLDRVCLKGYDLLFARVLKDLPANYFYRQMGGTAVAVEKSEFLGVNVELVCYRWDVSGQKT